MADWRFYGRSEQLGELEAILARGRWFFVQVTGRRRIGKTTLIRQALEARTGIGNRSVFYVQIPDSEPAGVLSAFRDALDAFGIPPERCPRPQSPAQLVRVLESLAEAGFVLVLDEFQYFNRKGYEEFCSLLQAAVDRLSALGGRIAGGLIVLGSIHTEMTALLEDRTAPLFNRVTDTLELSHLDVPALRSMLAEHADASPERLLFLWNLFEGVPKFYRDCHEQGVLGADRRTLLERIFFRSSSPLRTEAENWFLRELRGRYDVILKQVARRPGRMHKELLEAIRENDGSADRRIGGYLTVLTERFRLIERKLPIFAPADARRGRYYLTDNFLQSWLSALAGPVAAATFRPLDAVVREADERLAESEGRSLEKLAGLLYEARGRQGVGDFPLSERIRGYWDRGDVEIDLVAVDAPNRRLRCGSCKRDPGRLIADANRLRGHVARFLDAKPAFKDWTIELVGIAPRLDAAARAALVRHDLIPQDLDDLTAGLT